MLEPAGEGKPKTWGAAPLEKKMGLGLGFFVFFSDVVKIAPPPFV
jgi:hypothetical protein